MIPTTVFVDLETGGVEDTNPTIQIAAIAVDDWQEVASFERKIQFDEHRCEEDALAMNHYDPAVWEAEAVPAPEAFDAFVQFGRQFQSMTLRAKGTGRPYKATRYAGHNVATFDIPRIRRALERLGDPFWGCWWYPLDTYQRAVWHFAEHNIEPPENYQLAALAEYFGIDAGDAHDALADVRLSAKIAQVIITGGSS